MNNNPPSPPAATPEHTRTGTTAASLQQAILDNLYYIQGRTPELAGRNDWYMAVAYTVRDRMLGRDRSGPGLRQAHCRGLGRGRTLPGGQLHRRQLEGVERQIPGRCAEFSQGRPEYGFSFRLPSARQPGHLRP